MSLIKRLPRDGIVVLICLLLRTWTTSRHSLPEVEVLQNAAQEPDAIDEDTSFTVNCNLTTEEAKSAIERARTGRCKQLIADFACALERGEAFPETLVNSCPGDQNQIGEYLGCYAENRTLLPYVGIYDDNSVQKCVEICRLSGKVHAAVEGSECFCEDDISKLIKAEETVCKTICPGDASAKCGGNSSVSIYTTGFDEEKDAHWNSPAEGEDWGKLRIAFFLAINGRQLRQVKQLLRAIYTPDHLYLIHVEKRAQVLYEELLYLEEKYPNIRLQRERIRGNWGSPSLLHGIWNGIRELLQMGSWDYWINLSESCYPLEFIGDLEDFLASNRGLNFMSSPTENPFDSLKSEGVKNAYVECDDYLFHVGTKTLPKGIRIDFGSDWFVFHRSFAEFVVSDDPLIRGLQQIFNYSFLAPESFFHFAVQNSKFCSSVTNTNLHSINWKHKKVDGQCHSNKYGDCGGCSPVAYRKEDYFNLSYAGKRPDAYFARKFDARVSQSVITSLEEYVVDPPWIPGTPGLFSYWEPIFTRKRDQESEFSRHALEVSKKVLGGSDVIPQLSFLRVDTIHSFYDKDFYQGFLVKMYSVEDGDTLELYIKPKRTFKKLSDASLEGSRLHNLKVGRNYVQKEKIFENRAYYVNTGSKIVLEHRWMPSESEINVTFVWIDSHNNVANISNATVKNNTEVHSFSLDESVPLNPGEWTVVAVEDGAIAGYLNFPVFPSDSLRPQSTLVTSEPQELQKSVKSFISKRKRRHFERRNDMMTDLITKYYVLESICFDEANQYDSVDRAEVCQKTAWSSLSPDPKSEF